MSSLVDIPTNIAWYISGFVDGEGSFNISFRRKNDYNTKWQPILSFNVSQREKSVLILMKNNFNCGIIKRRKDGVHSYDVTTPIQLKRKIIPFFDKYGFLSERKKNNFSLFKRSVDLMVEKEHLNIEGLKRLIAIREEINSGAGRTRKYSARDILQDIDLESSETTR